MRGQLPIGPAWGAFFTLGSVLTASLCCSTACPQSPAAATAQDQRSSLPRETASEESLEERLHAAEAANKQVTEELAQIKKEHADQTNRLFSQLEELSRRLSDRSSPLDPASGGDEAVLPAAEGEASDDAETLPGIDESVPDYFDLDVTSPRAVPQETVFGPGFQMQSQDESFRLQIHYESQIEARVWSRADQVPANSGFLLPRQRFFFNGDITKLIEYELAINRGVNNINLLNAFINFHFDDRLKFRIGRFFTPLPYDQYAISNYWLLTTERSLFTTNLSLNRQIGAMAWGYLLDKRLDYAAGAFNGSRNSFQNLNQNVDFVGYLNVRPFQNSELFSFADNLNLGASTAYGNQDQSPVPVTFRIGAGSPDANVPGIATVPFLVLHPDVMERGERLLGSVHAAYFSGGLSVIGEWQYGFGEYASAGRPSSDRVPFSGFYVMTGYFLTGEQVERRTRVKPLRPLVPLAKDEQRGIGAVEPIARVSQLRLGEEVFTAGFADPSIWSNSALTTEVGVNWYWNDYIKFYFLWLNGQFGDPVQYRPGQLQKSAEMFALRCQLYF